MSNYAWLTEVGTLPKTITEGLKLLGTVETPGVKNNPIIMSWGKELGLEKSYSADSIPWCGLFAAIVTKRAGKDSVKEPLWARNWAKFGDAAGTPSLGDVLVFVRDGGGHVGFYVAEDSTAFHVLGGNQSDKVTITRIAKTRCIASRRPKYNVTPGSVKPYIVAATGAMSSNEA
jgi:uncharacterized protein (TIGR02594 family)